MAIEQIYGWAAALTCVVALFSKSAALEWIALLMLALWLASNVFFAGMHPPELLYFNISLDCIGAYMTVLITRRFRRLCAAMLVLFVFNVVWHALWIAILPPHFIWYYRICNAVMVLQLLAIVIECYRSRMAFLRERE